MAGEKSTLPDEFVNRKRRGREQLEQSLARLGNLRVACDGGARSGVELAPAFGERSLDERRKLFHHVGGALDEARALADEIVGAAAAGIERRARHGENFAPLVERAGAR